MNFDWFATYDISIEDDVNKCVNGTNRFCEVNNIFSQTKLLATCLDKNKKVKDYAKSGEKIKNPKGHKLIICRKKYNALITEELIRLKAMNLYEPFLNFSVFPPYSFFLQFNFTFATPYISRDDEEFYICDNPIRKDKVFKVPMVSGSSWKGNMRWTAMKIFADGLPEGINQNRINECFEYRAQMVRLFGHEKTAIADYLDSLLAEAISGDDKSNEKFIENKKFVKEKFKKFLIEKGYINTRVEGRRGRLNFYPTFFNQISLEVINPHDRKTKAGIQPLYIESVPVDADGTFSFLYMPFDLMGKPDGDVKEEVVRDLETVFHAIREMMLTYGFSAKKSSGFGIVREDIKGTFGMSGFPIYKTTSPQGQKIDDSNPFAKKLAPLRKTLPPEEVKDDSFSSFNELKQLT